MKQKLRPTSWPSIWIPGLQLMVAFTSQARKRLRETVLRPQLRNRER